jgi:phosphohistidine phosphatase SixA
MVHIYKLIIVYIIGFIANLPLSARAYEDAYYIDLLKNGGSILMIRHAVAPGTGDPPNFQIGDCATQRNLDDNGRAQAEAIGDWLRSNGIQKAKIYSSQWCRCLETAKLIKLGIVKELPALNSFFDRPRDREANIRALRTFIAEQSINGELVVLVTHYVTILEITQQAVSSGEGVVLKLTGNRTPEIIGRMSFGF